jgi:hypothetical protein
LLAVFGRITMLRSHFSPPFFVLFFPLILVTWCVVVLMCSSPTGVITWCVVVSLCSSPTGVISGDFVLSFVIL